MARALTIYIMTSLSALLYPKYVVCIYLPSRLFTSLVVRSIPTWLRAVYSVSVDAVIALPSMSYTSQFRFYHFLCCSWSFPQFFTTDSAVLAFFCLSVLFRPWNDVGWGVKLSSLTHSLVFYFKHATAEIKKTVFFLFYYSFILIVRAPL